ncbi:HAMP domain-containing protein [Neoasaia chiangmaiensis NBRC 101099]|uniref:Uncharacterized protein n=1 Tax=Neoasaia chiangmaiensis TaxID=320497 RepID=A0A1U9KLS0_9PROT|nr:DUF3365 domain-containing protein [Neoasaia chiangmaiensis]AQS86744.1 hypothetical protein A0U93_00885 [Neoasaia chiangmaiensis]GBR35597.1 HAMP domain-containing protein [Neoasaia chiangmaiensis NBRC 101099]GEN16405.1 hypothetical protein NCH01_28360 [Neoasaia chiangmaiensis]
MTLRLKIYATLGVIALVGYLALLASITHGDRTARVASAERSARLMIVQADAADQYTRHEIAPLLDSAMHSRLVFIPQSAGFYAVETQGRQIERALEGYRLRRVVLDSTGPADTPDGWERDAIMRLRGTPDGAPFAELRPDGALAYVVPLTMQDGICATCYPSRDQAPLSVRDAFGSAKGFDRHPGEIVGATIATVPVAPFNLFGNASLLLAALVLLICWASACLLIEFMVLRPLSQIATVAERVSLGAPDVEEFDTRSGGEIGALTLSFNRLRRSMETAMALVRP